MTLNTNTLIWARKKCGFTQTEAAKTLGVSRNTFIRWEKGSPEIPTHRLTKFLQLVNVSHADAPSFAETAKTETPGCFVGLKGVAGYDEAGYPLKWGYPTLKQFNDDEALQRYILKLLEGGNYKEREAFRVSQATIGKSLEVVEQLASEMVAVLHVAYPNGVPYPALLSAVSNTPEERTNAEEAYLVLFEEEKVHCSNNTIHLAGGEQHKATANAADPGGVKRAAAAREEARARAIAAEESEKAEVAAAEAAEVRKLLAQKKIEEKVANIMAAKAEEARFRAEQKKG